MSVCEFISQLFTRLNEEKVIYCILRNYENLPEWTSNDIDIWVDKKDWAKFFSIVKSLSYTLDYTLDYTPRLTVKGEGDYFLIKERLKSIEAIHLDCWAYFHWKGMCFLDESIMGKNLIWHEKGFYIPSRGIEAVINLMKDLIYHGKVKAKYKDLIETYAQNDSEIFIKSITKPFGLKTAKFILEMAKSGNWEALEKRVNKSRIILFLRAFLEPISQVIKWFYYLRAQIRRFFINPRGLFLVLIGPDGSGKSTTAEELIKTEFTKKLFQKKYYFHGHFPYLPELKKITGFIKRKKLETGYSTNVAGNPIEPFNVIRAMIYPIYYGFNYFLGHFFIWKEKGRAGLIVFDRYFYDYMIQNIYANCPRQLLYLIAKIIPKPDILIYLRNDPKVIYARKPELSIEEIKRQSKICEYIQGHFNNSFMIEATLPINEVVEQIQKVIIKRIKEKQKVRL